MIRYGFRPSTVDNLPMLGRWLWTSEAMRWSGEPEKPEKLPADTLGLGVPAMIGHGSVILRLLAQRLLADGLTCLCRGGFPRRCRG